MSQQPGAVLGLAWRVTLPVSLHESKSFLRAMWGHLRASAILRLHVVLARGRHPDVQLVDACGTSDSDHGAQRATCGGGVNGAGDRPDRSSSEQRRRQSTCCGV